MTFGDFEVIPLLDGSFRLDGGAMFGVVPKPLWQKRTEPDERNRIPLGLRPLLVKTREHNILIDAGIGDKMGPKDAEIYAIDRRPGVEQSLADAGVGIEDVDVVIASHLHFDHAGGFTTAGWRSHRAGVSTRDLLHPPAGMGRCDASSRTQPCQLSAGEFRAAGRRRRRAVRFERR